MNEHYYYVPLSIDGQSLLTYVNVSAREFAKAYKDIRKYIIGDRIVSIDIEYRPWGTHHFLRYCDYGYKVKFFYYG